MTVICDKLGGILKQEQAITSETYLHINVQTVKPLQGQDCKKHSEKSSEII